MVIKKNNPWKIGTFVLISISFILLAFNFFNGNYDKDYKFNFNGDVISISKENFNALTNILKVGQAKAICDTSNYPTGPLQEDGSFYSDESKNKCVGVIKIG